MQVLKNIDTNISTTNKHKLQEQNKIDTNYNNKYKVGTNYNNKHKITKTMN